MTRTVTGKAEKKQALRKHFLSLRESIPAEEAAEKSRRILSRLTSHPVYQKCTCLYTYVDFRNEVQTLPLIRQALAEGRPVAVPKTAGADMTFYYITDPAELTPGRFGILEPGRACEEAHAGDALLILPGAAFDRKGGRLGYGGGFYDRYLAAHPAHTLAALAYDLQIADELPTEPFDHRTPRIFTETALITIKEEQL